MQDVSCERCGGKYLKVVLIQLLYTIVRGLGLQRIYEAA